MPQISRFPLKKKVREEIIRSFWWLIACFQRESEVERFFNEFLTETEKLMFAKRLAIALMLEKGYSFYDIRNTLKVSTSTIFRISNWLEKSGGGYRVAIKKFTRKEKLDEFWKEIGSFVEVIGRGKRVFPRSKR